MIEKLVNGDHLKRLDNIVQWLEHDGFTRESVAEHSFKVAVFTRAILEEVFGSDDNIEKSLDIEILRFKLNCVTHALHHDFDEAIFLRDVSHNVKYNKFNGTEIRHAIDVYVRHQFEEDFRGASADSYHMMHASVIAIPTYVKPVVKLADWLALYYHCKRELSLGNNKFNEVTMYCKQNILESVEIVIGDVNAVFNRNGVLTDSLDKFRQKIHNIVNNGTGESK